jgi:cell division protein ZipA
VTLEPFPVHPPVPEPIRVGVVAEEAVDIPGATTVVAPEEPKPIRWPPEQLPDRVLGLRVIAANGMFGGKPVRLALLAAGLRYGPQQIFHTTDYDGNVLASVANLVRPGSLVPEQMDGHEFRGLSLFAVLPGPRPAEQMLEGLVQLARQLAGRLGGIVQDEHGKELDSERLVQLRRVVADIENGDGAGA